MHSAPPPPPKGTLLRVTKHIVLLGFLATAVVLGDVIGQQIAIKYWVVT